MSEVGSQNGLEELQQVELELLDEFIRICEKHHLRHFMIGGTLLGAVRHQGFIPWDDDIDMCMPRPDYLEFARIAESELPEGMYFSSIYTNPEHRSGFARICTDRVQVVNRALSSERVDDAWIDVFPLDGFPTGLMRAPSHKVRLFCWRAMSRLAQFDDAVDVKRKRSLVESLMVKIASLRIFRLCSDYGKYLRKMDRALMRYPYDEATLIIEYDGGVGFNELFPLESYGAGKKYLFNGRQVWGPSDPKPVLEAIYGPDYMVPSPEGERNWHNIQVIRKANQAYESDTF